MLACIYVKQEIICHIYEVPYMFHILYFRMGTAVPHGVITILEAQLLLGWPTHSAKSILVTVKVIE